MPIDIVSSQLYVCHILVSKKCQLQAGTIWYWGKELLTQQVTGSSTQTQPCDNAMSMAMPYQQPGYRNILLVCNYTRAVF